MMRRCPGILILSFLLLSATAWSQQPTRSMADTGKIVRILKADKLVFDRRDSLTDKVILVGHVEMQQGKTLFYCDSAIKDNITNQVEAFGNIHINDADSVHTYSQYLRFDGNSRIARLQKKVRLTDGKADLTTNELEYDLNAKIGTYINGGKVVNKNSVLTSQEGYYYADTREVYFKDKVRLTDPEYTMATDTLLYNIDQELATFLAATTINDGKSTIRTRSGYYDLKNGNASFGNRPVIEDSTQQIIAEKINYDKKSGAGLAEGNVIYRDTAQGATILAGLAEFNSNTKQVLATRKPLLILKQNKDSIYITGDTLLSLTVVDTVQGATDSAAVKDSVNPAVIALSKTDTIQSVTVMDTRKTDTIRLFHAFRHVRIFSDSLQGVCDSLSYSSLDSVFRFFRDPVLWAKDSQVSGDTIYLFTKNKKADQVFVFENGFSINRTPESYFNQIKGNRLNGYFKDGNIDYMRAKGNAESVYYLQDSDSAYIGMNYARADAISMYFVEKDLKKVTWVNGVEGTTYPFRQIPEDKKQLRNFNWQESRRPKTRFELFGQ
ncbi:MAG: LPS export ABC transporter periplasmic protein LptC [Chitinophagaceae bacterium]|jgi:lipopolysaccharide export system protein LptA|nr:LPS export ABC transporter periplasmic protein LptC [Chitinophagaceae bacterium]